MQSWISMVDKSNITSKVHSEGGNYEWSRIDVLCSTTLSLVFNYIGDELTVFKHWDREESTAEGISGHWWDVYSRTERSIVVSPNAFYKLDGSGRKNISELTIFLLGRGGAGYRLVHLHVTVHIHTLQNYIPRPCHWLHSLKCPCVGTTFALT